MCKATCSCPAGKSGHCNRVMALLYENAEYSLNQLTEVPQEKACTIVLKKWGVPVESNLSIESIITDKTFYVALNKDKKPYLKKEHHFGYYTQIQVAMRLAGLKWCHFVVYVYSRIIIVKTDFDRDYFKSVIDNMNDYYKGYYIIELLNRANSG